MTATPPASGGDPGGLLVRTERLALAQVAAANVAGAALGYVYAAFVAQGLGPGEVDVRTSALSLGLLAAIMLLAGARMVFRTRRLFAGIAGWMGGRRAPSPDEQAAVLSAPWMLAGVSLFYWVVGAILFAGLVVVAFEARPREAGQVASVALGAGLVTSALAYLLVERTFRPLFAAVLTGGRASQVPTPGIRARLLIAWALGSAVPLLGIASALVRGAREDVPVTGAIGFLVAVGLLTGLQMSVLAARSLSEPLEAVRSAMREVESGRVEAEVAVDDGGEIGLLQSGFNTMVSGLREREHLKDLFGRHVGDQVAERALRRGVELGGTRATATVLFVDIAGSTAIAAARPPEDVVALLNDFFAQVVSCAESHHGWVNKFVGDGAVCVFGVPAGEPDHAARGLRAAIDLRDSLRDLKAIDAGIAVSSGEVLAGNVGSLRRYEYTVIGDPVNEAARLVDVAKSRPGRLVASSSAVESSGAEAARWRTIGPVVLRGRSEATLVFEPVTD